MTRDPPRTPPTSRPSHTKRESQRSRKGCPECRSRKIKCDEQKPECGQCRKTGRVCRIIDSLFKPHSYSFLAGLPKPELGANSHSRVLSPAPGLDTLSPQNRDGDGHSRTRNVDELEQAIPQVKKPAEDNQKQPTNTRTLDILSINSLRAGTDNSSPIDSTQVEPKTVDGSRPNDLDHLSDRPGPTLRDAESPYISTLNQIGDSYQDRCEIAFFLRHFSEGPGRWMDVCGGQSYFSQQIVLLSHWSPLVRYAACALAAKQLGQMKDPESQIRQTNSQTLMMRALIDSKLGFTWYGAKYYERAIQLLAKQISNEDRTSLLSPSYIYGSGLTPQTGDCDLLREHDKDAAPFQILAASILCQYEDVNATMRAWSGHLDGIYRLFRPHLLDPISFHISRHIPQPMRALDAVFWFFVLHDMLNAFVCRRRTRIDTGDLLLWCRMGLPLDGRGHLVWDYIREGQPDVILFKGLLRMMCQLVNSDLSDSGQWNSINQVFDHWRSIVPTSFYVPISWPPVIDSHAPQNADAFSKEIWFASDLCAITLAFYHMARMILLIHRPMELFLKQSRNRDDLLATYNTLQQDLRQHALEIIPIMNSRPSETVRKFMLQPLYVAGRCLTDNKERNSLLQMLRGIEDDFGLFTDYRIKDLCEQWRMKSDEASI